jgi:hypothetical protein
LELVLCFFRIFNLDREIFGGRWGWGWGQNNLYILFGRIGWGVVNWMEWKVEELGDGWKGEGVGIGVGLFGVGLYFIFWGEMG